jgi:hypothetical protein
MDLEAVISKYLIAITIAVGVLSVVLSKVIFDFITGFTLFDIETHVYLFGAICVMVFIGLDALFAEITMYIAEKCSNQGEVSGDDDEWDYK